MEKSKTIGIITFFIMSILVLTSCDKEGYEPISTSTDACQIIVNCLDHNGKSLPLTINLLMEFLSRVMLHTQR